MDPKKNGISNICPHLDDQKYSDWKVHMSTFIKSLGIEVCQSIVTRWTTPTKIEKGRILINVGPEWNSKEKKAAISNITALNAI